jgi:TetR/AcrR family transcriptional regulator, cholesterol catabolism regulator
MDRFGARERRQACCRSLTKQALGAYHVLVTPARDIVEQGAPRGRGRPPKDGAGGGSSRRTRILDAATLRFAKFGFRATTVRQIADDVGLGSGSLFHHFATKEDMLGEIVRPAVIRLRDEARRISQAQDGAEQRLVDLIHANLHEITSNPEIHAILDIERKLLRRRDDFADIVEARSEAYRGWERIFEDGITEARFRSDLDRFLTITTIVRMLSSAAEWHRSEDQDLQASGKAYDLDSLSGFYRTFVLLALRRADFAAARVPEPSG